MVFLALYFSIRSQSCLEQLGLLNFVQRHLKTAGIVSALLARFEVVYEVPSLHTSALPRISHPVSSDSDLIRNRGVFPMQPSMPSTILGGPGRAMRPLVGDTCSVTLSSCLGRDNS